MIDNNPNTIIGNENAAKAGPYGSTTGSAKSPEEEGPHSSHLSGLTDADCDRYATQRIAFMNKLISKPSGRSALRQCFPEIDVAATAVIDEIKQLADGIEGHERKEPETNPSVASSARAAAATVAMWDIHDAADDGAAAHRYVPRSRWFGYARSLHEYLDKKMPSGRLNEAPKEQLKKVVDIWGSLRLYLSIGVVACLLTGHVAAATLLFSARLVGTLLCWVLVAFPADDSPDHPVLESDARLGALSHAGDMAVMFAMSLQLILDRESAIGLGAIEFHIGGAVPHVLAGVMVWLSSMIMILGTVFRMATEAPRLNAERMVRSASIAVALLIFNWEHLWLWGAITVTIGPLIFTAIEGRESWKKMADKDDEVVERIGERIQKTDEPIHHEINESRQAEPATR